MPIDPETVNRLLFSTLNEIQHSPLPASTSGVPIVNQIHLVRDSENAKNAVGMTAVTIDIVAMLFDFIFDDTHVPVAIKALLSRLQIPVLKVAMLNPSFFTDRQHPTRRFLGSISGISIRWGRAVDESDPFYQKLADLVERIQSEFEEDVEVFGTALAKLDAFVNENENTENRPTLAAAHLAMQHEQQAEALEQAERALRTFRAGKQIPELLNTFLETHWIRVLKNIALNNVIDGPEWQSGLETMRDLVWSVEAKKAPDDRLKLISLLPKLLSHINTGLDGIGTPTAQRQEFFDRLVKCHSAALKGEPLPQPAPATEPKDTIPKIKPLTEGELQVKRSIDDGVEIEEVVLIGAPPVWRADEREIARQVEDLKRGDWVDFLDEKGDSNRVRLNWISPHRGIMVFSNNRSAKAISIDPEALARQIRNGKAEIVQQVEVFERALSGALESINAG